MNQKDNTSANDTNDVSRIVPEKAIQQAADYYGYAVDAVRAAVSEDLERNQRMADRILDRREIVQRDDDYVVVLASDGVTDETRMPVLGVYEQMDDSDSDWAAGYPLVIPTTENECPYDLELESANRRGDDR